MATKPLLMDRDTYVSVWIVSPEKKPRPVSGSFGVRMKSRKLPFSEKFDFWKKRLELNSVTFEFYKLGRFYGLG